MQGAFTVMRRVPFGALSVSILAAVSAPLSLAEAAVVKSGKAFATSSCRCLQSEPAVAGIKNGAFLVGWAGFTEIDSKAVVRRYFATDGKPQGQPEVVNSATQFVAEFEIDLAGGGPAGQFVAVWSTATTSTAREVLFRRLASNGAPLGAPALVRSQESTAPTSDRLPSVAVGPDGGFAVAWLSQPLVGAPPGPPTIQLRRFSAAGKALGAPVQVNTGLTNGQRPEVCIDPTNSSAIVIWPTVKQILPFQQTPVGVSLRRVSSAGVPLGSETALVKPLLASTNVGLSCSPKGGFVAVWQSTLAPAGGEGDVVAVRYDKKGKKLGPPFVIPSNPAGGELRPRVSHDSDGSFVVVWEDSNETSFTIEGRRFLASGKADGDDFEVIARPSSGQRIIHPDIAHRGAKGEFVVVFEKQSVVNGQRLKLQ